MWFLTLISLTPTIILIIMMHESPYHRFQIWNMLGMISMRVVSPLAVLLGTSGKVCILSQPLAIWIPNNLTALPSTSVWF